MARTPARKPAGEATGSPTGKPASKPTLEPTSQTERPAAKPAGESRPVPKANATGTAASTPAPHGRGPAARPLVKTPPPMQIIRPAPEALELGDRLRSARKERGLSIEQVATLAGITKSFLSRLERDAVAASVATLLRVCNAIGIRPGSLFDPPTTNLVRASERVPISLGGEGMSEFLISGAGNEHMMALLSIIEPQGGSGSEPYTLKAAADLVHIKQGQMVMVVDNVSHHLTEGDTFTFPPGLPHMWFNPSSSEQTVALWVIVPPP
ncbi:MAG: helix-turn-helix protein [Rhizobacter sp.]|nr:helix-turn-helix protein [Rhizobacter sp.]